MSNHPPYYGNAPHSPPHLYPQQHQQQHIQQPEQRPYSYLHTPVALQGPTFSPPDNPSHTAPSEQTNQQSHSQPNQPGNHRPFSYVSPDADKIVDESLSTVSNNRNDADYVNNLYTHVSPPPLSEHPAQFAPFADSTTPPPNPRQIHQAQEQEYHQQQQSRQQEQYQREQEYQHQQHFLQQHQQLQQQQHGVVPHSPMAVPQSPGPLPVKQNLEAEARERQAEEAAIVPDSNPLAPQSPAPTYASHSGPQRMNGRSISAVPDIQCHTPGQAFHPLQSVKGGSWMNGLCECSDIGVCCLGLWCPCILYGRTQHRLSRKSKRQDPTNMLGYESCNASCTAMALLCGCQWLLATIQHTRIRRAYGIPGGIMSDCVRASCCTCCTLIQDEREIKTREESSRTGGNTVSAPYAAPGQMTFSPPPR
ncbi:hypothetical protein H109_00119 [Trichophyton interdigitale MR816]|uniref:DUF614 domain-containing protein n=1 Tax=Trichophyton interdigitale (strain MR816) TaxID=1215338 RepID=A0A059JJT4_TRIIM|nr:hypothetical protein H101_04362 [Trichophyton interdigitale H6]KDB28120.1 hypothetical protein H109_00119 [Trichophyton interdigitale MR816]